MSAKPRPEHVRPPAPFSRSTEGAPDPEAEEEARLDSLVARGLMSRAKEPGGVTVEFLDSLGPKISDPTGSVLKALLDERWAADR